MKKKSGHEKRNFSGFDVKNAMQALSLLELNEWRIDFQPVAPTPLFHENMERLKHFDLSSTERAKELIIDEIFKEALVGESALKIWKAAPLSSNDLTGEADYLIAPRRRYLATPLLCVVEAKRDDFEKGLAQCLVEMKACRDNNTQDGHLIDVYGIVTNGSGWVFYWFDLENKVWETVMYSLANIDQLLGVLGYVFDKCEENISLL
jgi:hypothetical protein